MVKSRTQSENPKAKPSVARQLEHLAGQLRRRLITQADYDRKIDQLLGTQLPDRDLEAEATYERRRRAQTT